MLDNNLQIPETVVSVLTQCGVQDDVVLGAVGDLAGRQLGQRTQGLHLHQDGGGGPDVVLLGEDQDGEVVGPPALQAAFLQLQLLGILLGQILHGSVSCPEILGEIVNVLC